MKNILRTILFFATILILFSVLGVSDSFAISPNYCSEYLPQPVINLESNFVFQVIQSSNSEIKETVMATNGFNINERSELLADSFVGNFVDVNIDSNKVYVASFKKIQAFDGISFEKIFEKKTDIISEGLWIDSTTNNVYLYDVFAKSLYVKDESGYPKLKTLTFEEMVVDVGIDHDTNRVFVAMSEIPIGHEPSTKGSVVILNAKTNEIVETIDIKGEPIKILINPNTNLTYLLKSDSKSITVIDKTNSISESIELDFIPTSMTLNPIKNEIYLLNCEDSFISVLNSSINKQTSRLDIKEKLDSNPANGIVYNEKTGQVFLTDYYSGLVDVIQEEEFPKKSGMEKMIQSPLKQIHSGISLDRIICKEGLGLILKKTDNSPACVKPSTAEKLIERGWAKSNKAIETHTTQPMLEPLQKCSRVPGEEISCAPDFVCYEHLSGGLGFFGSLPIESIGGDKQCHQECFIDNDCPTNAPICLSKKLSTEDYVEGFYLCFSEEDGKKTRDKKFQECLEEKEIEYQEALDKDGKIFDKGDPPKPQKVNFIGGVVQFLPYMIKNLQFDGKEVLENEYHLETIQRYGDIYKSVTIAHQEENFAETLCKLELDNRIMKTSIYVDWDPVEP